MTTVHHTPIVAGASNDPATVNTPLGQLDAAIVADAAAIAAETAARIAGDNAEATARQAADNAEATARQAADNAEIAARIAGDNAQAAARIAAINAEASARVAGDGILSDRIDDLIIVGGGDPGPEVTAARTAVPYNVGSPPATLGEALAYAAGEVHNVQAYGAAGDGVTDDTAAIQAALDAAAGDGGVVLLPRAAYLVSDTLTLPGSNVTVQGSNTTITQDTEYTSTLLITGHGNRVRGITFVGTGTGDQGPTSADTFVSYGAGVVLKQCNDNVVEYCQFVDCGTQAPGTSPRGYTQSGAGVYVNGGANHVVQHCKFNNCTMGINEDDWTNTAGPAFTCKGHKYLYNEFGNCFRGILVDYGSAPGGVGFVPPIIHGNYFHSPHATVDSLDSRAIYLALFACEHGARVTGNTIDGAFTFAIAMFPGGRSCVIADNTINGAGASLELNAGDSFAITRLSVTGNTLKNCNRGILLYNVRHSTFADNTIDGMVGVGPTGVTGCGVHVSGVSRANIFRGNTIINCNYEAMRFTDAWATTIVGNFMAYNSQAAALTYSAILIKQGTGYASGFVITGNNFDETVTNANANTQDYAVKAETGFYTTVAYKTPGVIQANYFGRTNGVSEPNPNTASGFLVRNNVFADNRDSALQPVYYEGRLTGSKTGVAHNSATNLADIALSGSASQLAGYLVSLTVSSGSTASTQIWLVTQGFSAATATKLSEALYGHSSIALTATADTGNRKVRLSITQVNGAAQACTVSVAVRPLIVQGSPAITLTML